MLDFMVGLLTVLMFLTCVFLILLVLVQLPKKEAGAGLVFGGAATDALFGAGSGNMLTKITKWTAGAFFVLTLVVSIATTKQRGRNTSLLEEELRRKSSPAPVALPFGSTNLLQTAPATDTSVPPQTILSSPAEGQPAPAGQTPAEPQGTTPPQTQEPQSPPQQTPPPTQPQN